MYGKSRSTPCEFIWMWDEYSVGRSHLEYQVM